MSFAIESSPSTGRFRCLIDPNGITDLSSGSRPRDTSRKKNNCTLKGCKKTSNHPPPVMASTYLSLHYHIVFGTKDRMPLIAASWRPKLYEYMGGVIKGLDGVPEKIGGVEDHVHLLVGLKSTHCLADFLRELKKASTSWIHGQTELADKFTWQGGYAAFTVSATSLEAVRDYIAKQEDHHRVRTFREEFITMLEKAGISYDAKYLD